MSMLEVKDLEVYYGVIQAIKGISFHVEEGEVIALIGANGAGKTTTLQTITGMLNAQAGSIQFEGTELTKIPGHKIVSMGMAHVPEGRRVFAQLSVLENLKLGAYTRKDKTEIEESLKRVYKSFPRLEERKNQLAGTLSGGEQQRVSIARALAKNPKLLLCDEPTGALDYQTGKAILKLLQDMCRERGMTVIVITHNSALTPMADRVIKIKNGKVSRMTMNDHPTPIEEIEW